MVTAFLAGLAYGEDETHRPSGRRTADLGSAGAEVPVPIRVERHSVMRAGTEATQSPLAKVAVVMNSRPSGGSPQRQEK